jgi:hypothetical protein
MAKKDERDIINAIIKAVEARDIRFRKLKKLLNDSRTMAAINAGKNRLRDSRKRSTN